MFIHVKRKAVKLKTYNTQKSFMSFSLNETLAKGKLNQIQLIFCVTFFILLSINRKKLQKF